VSLGIKVMRIEWPAGPSCLAEPLSKQRSFA
jgi:hypothetical protein